MPANIDFKDLYQQQGSPEHDVKEIYGAVQKLRRSKIRSIVLANIFLLFTSFAIGWIWIEYQPQMISTKLGMIIVILAMLIMLFFINRTYSFYNELNEDQSASEYLKKLLDLREKEKFLQVTLMNGYFLALFVGIFLYLYEYTSRMKLIPAISVNLISFLWIAFNWFYIRPKQLTKSKKKLDGVIEEVKRVTREF